jgi:predicted glycogen debranching enzyme
MKLIINKQICSKFESGINREWLESNRFGTYSSSTIYGLNSRPYHGLFVIPHGSLKERIVILSKFEESIFVGTKVYEISTNQFVGGVHPHGFRYLEEFRIDPFPRFIFRIEHRRIEKTLFLLHDKNTLVLQYTNKNQGEPVKLIIKPIIAGRKTNELSKEKADIIIDSYSDGRVVKIAPKPEIPEIQIFHSRGEFFQAPLWYHDFKYDMEYIEEGIETDKNTEDLFNPGFFSCTLEPYESCDFFVSVDPIEDYDYEAIFRKEKDYRRRISSNIKSFPGFSKDIYESIRASRISQMKEFPLILLNHPTYNTTTREMILALPGLMLVEKNINTIKRVINHLVTNLKEGLFPETYPLDESESYSGLADCSLHFINFAYYFMIIAQDKSFLEDTLFDSCKSIVDAFSKGTKHNIYKDKDDLIHTGDKSVNTSWIPLKDGKGNVLRYGKLIEMNALWYNALKVMESLCQILRKNRMSKRYAKMATLTKESFLEYFYDKTKRSFFDLIRHDLQDKTFRINQLFLIGLPYSMLTTDMGEKLLKKIDNELLTPYGLRSLSYKDKQYQGHHKEYITCQHPDYYLGSVWPWTIGMYIDAVIKIMGQNKTVTDYLKKVIAQYKVLFYEIGLGYIPEVFEGNEPYGKNGILTYYLNITELFRASYTLKMIMKKDPTEYKLK